jgi:hypothetical protein
MRMATGLVAYDNTNGERVSKGSSATDRIAGTVYATSLDLSSSITVGTNTMKGDRISVSGGTGDPGTLVAGDLWYRTDLGKFKFRNASTAVELLDASTAIANPGTKATNDILQYTSGGTWDAVGAAAGDPVLGTLCVQGLNTSMSIAVGATISVANGINFTNDNAYDLGESSTTKRPRTIYAGTSVVINGQTAMKATDATGGDLSGTYPSTLTVVKVQGYSMTSGAPAKGDFWQFDGTNWIHDRSRYRVLAIGTGSSSGSEATIAQYTAAANEFSANSMILVIFEVNNPAATVQTRVLWNTTQVSEIGGWSTSQNTLFHYIYEQPNVNSYAQNYVDYVGGSSGAQTNVGTSNWITSGTTWYAKMTRTAAAGTVYARAYIIEIRKE